MEVILGLGALGLLLSPFVMSLIALLRSGRYKALDQRLLKIEKDLQALRGSAVSGNERTIQPEAILPRAASTSTSPLSSEALPPFSTAQTMPADFVQGGDTNQKTPDSWVPPSYRDLSSSSTEAAARLSAEGIPPERPLAQAAFEIKEEKLASQDVVATPPPPPPLPPPSGRPPAPSAKPGSGIEWERWIGVRGAAVLGGFVLALAGILFFKYSIEHGLISPTTRVIIGTGVGLFCLIMSARMRHRQYLSSANAVAAGGIVILYAAFWAAKAMYGLIGMGMAFALMALVTMTCCLLCVRYSSRLIAVLGIIGGFATPILLSTGVDRPISLFSYILLLDLAFLWIAQKKQWSTVALLTLIATFIMEGLWIVERMTPMRLILGLSILAVFTMVYLLASERAAVKDKIAWKLSQYASIFFSFGFALYFSVQADFSAHLYPIASLILLLDFAAAWISKRKKNYGLSSMTAAATLAVYFVWTASHWINWIGFSYRPIATGMFLEVLGIFFATGLIFHIFAELEKENKNLNGPGIAAILSNAGLFAILIFSLIFVDGVASFYWLLAFLAFGALLLRQAGFAGRRFLQIAAPVLLSLGFGSFLIRENASLQFKTYASSINLFIPLVLAWVLQIVASLRRQAPVREYGFHGAALFSFGLVFFISGLSFNQVWPGELVLVSTLLLGFLIVLSATQLSSSFWYAIGVAVTAFAHTFWSFEVTYLRFEPSALRNAFILQSLAVLFFTFWPLLAARRFKKLSFAWVIAALAGGLWFFSLKKLFVMQFGDGFIGVLPVTLSLLTGLAASQARKLWQPLKTPSQNAQIWFTAVSLSFISVAIPLQLHKEWILIGWALQGLALFLLWKKADHPGLKYFGFALLALVVVRLLFYNDIIAYYPRGSWRIVNWTMYTYLIPAFCLLFVATLLYKLELPRLRSWEKSFYPQKFSPMAVLLSISAILLIFVWINLAIADWFAVGVYLSVTFERLPARDLTTSIAWAVYALILLMFGMWKDRGGLRWVSLIFLILTIGKVFLYDLGQLRDLYRVLSLLGLALSLILVSLLYQRFVFKKQKNKTEVS